jgi:hypothetical protein
MLRKKDILIVLVTILFFFTFFTKIIIADEIKNQRMTKKSTQSKKISLIYSSDSVCKKMVTGEKCNSRLPICPPDNSKKIELFETPGDNSFSYVGDFDINNDGYIEDIYLYYPCTRYACAYIYFAIKDEDSFIDEHWPDVTEEMMLSHSKYVYPCSWLAKPNEIRFCEPFTSEKKGANIISDFPISKYKSSDKANYYIMRYLYLEPFQFGGKTYFLASTEAWALKNIYTVLEPLRNGKVKEACIFRGYSDKEELE